MPINRDSAPGDNFQMSAWKLPALHGRRLTVVLSAYVIAVVLVFILIAGSFWFNSRDYFGNMPAAAEYGFRTRTTDAGPRISSVARREPGRSDLKEGDQILSIDGAKLPEDATEFTVAEQLAAAKDTDAIFVTRSPDGKVRTHRIDRAPVTSSTIEPSVGLPLWLYIAIGFGSAQLPLLAWFGASLFLAWRRPRDSEAMLLAFAFLLLCISRPAAFWLNAIAGIPPTVIAIAGNLGGSVMLLAMAGFPDGRFSNVFARAAVAFIGVLSIVVIAVPLTGASYRLMDIVAIFAVVCVLASVWRRYRSTTDQAQRQQIKWAIFGFSVSLALFLPVLVASGANLIPDDGLVPFLLYLVVVQLGWLLVPIGLLISLMRYRLYDADAAISRSAAYATLTLALAALFAASSEGLEWMFQSAFGREAGALPNAIAAALAVLAFNPLNNRIQHWAEQRFQKNLAHLRRDLPECVEDMREISSLDRLLATILEKVTAGVRAERAAVVIGRDVTTTRGVAKGPAQIWFDKAGLDPAAEPLDCDRDDEMFPMRLPLRVRHAVEGTFGWLLLGPRPDESFYGRDEQEALAELVDPISRAVQIVLVREARKAEDDRRWSDQDQRVGVLERKLSEAMKSISDLSRKLAPPAA